MKNFRIMSVVILSLMLSVFFLAFVGCKKDDSSESAPVSESELPSDNSEESTNGGITLNYYNKDLIYGDGLSLIATYEVREGETLLWKSSNENVVTVNDDGDVKTVSTGEADVVATYGEYSAKCHIKVSFGQFLPQLVIENVSDNYIVLGKGGDYNIHGYVYFNNVRYYDGVEIKCEIADTSIATADDNMTIAAKNVGETEMILSTTWKGFSGSTLQKTVKVKVVEDVEANTFVTVGETTEITDKIRLSLVGEWQGKTYDDFATLTGELIVGGERQNVTFEYIKEDGTDVISIKDNKVVAENIGSSYVEARCSYNGVEYVNVIEIAVTCPVEEYEGSFDYCVSEDFDVNNVFGAGAVILSATQGDRKLTVKRGKLITDIVPRGRETEEICVLSSLGGYVFKSVNAYTKAIKTADEFIEALTLKAGGSISGYYYLDNDITVDMTSQIGSFYETNGQQNRYFEGVFDGQNYTVNATVGTNGIFGGLGKDSVIKNTHFNFTFSIPDNAPIKTACGLARNDGAVFLQGQWNVKLSNLKITTTNYFDGSDGSEKRSYALLDFMNYRLSMEDILVVINGAAVDYTNYTQQVGALFRVDCNSMCASCDSMYNGGFKNIRVVTGVFMPMSNGYFGDIGTNKSYYTTYASTDYSPGKTDGKAVVGSRGGTGENTAFCKITPSKDTSESQRALLGEVFFVDSFDGQTKSNKYAWVYSSSVTNGGIYRYNTIAELKDSGVTKVGVWNVG